jgi:hypothetical protein
MQDKSPNWHFGLITTFVVVLTCLPVTIFRQNPFEVALCCVRPSDTKCRGIDRIRVARRWRGIEAADRLTKCRGVARSVTSSLLSRPEYLGLVPRQDHSAGLPGLVARLRVTTARPRTVRLRLVQIVGSRTTHAGGCFAARVASRKLSGSNVAEGREASGPTPAARSPPFVRAQRSATKCKVAKGCYHTYGICG